MAKEFRLNDARGSFVCHISKAEAMEMRSNGKIEKIGRNSYRLNAPPDPSTSQDSSACLTGGTRRKGDGGDCFALAGILFSGGKLKQEQKERLIGWGLLQTA
jgi:hypothetical protein